MSKTKQIIEKYRPTVVIFLLAFCVVSVPFYFSLFRETTNSRHGCERLNIVRETQYTQLKNNRNATKQLVQTSGSLQEIIIRQGLIEQETQQLIDLRNSVREFADGKISPVHVDCSKAYTNPWPFE